MILYALPAACDRRQTGSSDDASMIRSLAIWFHVDFFYAALVSISFVDLIIITLICFDKINGRPYKPFLTSLILFMIVQTGIVILRHR